jgi:DNA recombination protein RmuC
MFTTENIILFSLVSTMIVLLYIGRLLFSLLSKAKQDQLIYSNYIIKSDIEKTFHEENLEKDRVILLDKIKELEIHSKQNKIKTQDSSTIEQFNLIGQNLMQKQDSAQDFISKSLAEFNKSFNSVNDLKDNVKGLNEILLNKQARGSFSEVILENLIKTVMSEAQYSFQQQLSNNTRVDCALRLDHEGGKLMCIDSKFPLDAYAKYINKEAKLSDIKRDFKKHISDISQKYIIHGETSEWALMYIPSEVIFTLVHSEMPDLVAFSFKEKVAIVSPNSMMATIVTVNAAIRDYTFNTETVKIRNLFLDVLKEFERWNDRFEKVKSSYKRMGDELENASISSKKINTKLEKINAAQIED